MAYRSRPSNRGLKKWLHDQVLARGDRACATVGVVLEPGVKKKPDPPVTVREKRERSKSELTAQVRALATALLPGVREEQTTLLCDGWRLVQIPKAGFYLERWVGGKWKPRFWLNAPTACNPYTSAPVSTLLAAEKALEVLQ